MNGLSYLPVFLLGLLGSVHCIGMCGGIVTAFSLTPPRPRPFPVSVISANGAVLAGGPAGVRDELARALSYNAGRIASYAMAGALAGGIAGGAMTLARVSMLQSTAYVFANLMLIMLGLYLMDAWRGLARLEQLGQGVWRRVQPLTKRLLPLDSPFKFLLMGALWGWLPCGMVYSVLLTAMLSGSARGGAAVMLAFGLGTLPALMLVGLFGTQLRKRLQRRTVRVACGMIVLSFGALGLMRAAHGTAPHWFDSFCIVPAAGETR